MYWITGRNKSQLSRILNANNSFTLEQTIMFCYLWTHPGCPIIRQECMLGFGERVSIRINMLVAPWILAHNLQSFCRALVPFTGETAKAIYCQVSRTVSFNLALSNSYKDLLICKLCTCSRDRKRWIFLQHLIVIVKIKNLRSRSLKHSRHWHILVFHIFLVS